MKKLLWHNISGSQSVQYLSLLSLPPNHPWESSRRSNGEVKKKWAAEAGVRARTAVWEARGCQSENFREPLYCIVMFIICKIKSGKKINLRKIYYTIRHLTSRYLNHVRKIHISISDLVRNSQWGRCGLSEAIELYFERCLALWVCVHRED